MASPEPPQEDASAADPTRDDETVDATVAAGPRPAPMLDRIDLPVYRPRRRVAVTFWLAFVLAAVLVAGVVFLILG